MKRVGESAYLVEVSSSEAALDFYGRVEARGLPSIDEIIPGAASVLIVFGSVPSPEDVDLLTELASTPTSQGAEGRSREHEIRVRYDGPDLDHLARSAGLDRSEVVDLHSGAEYRVAFLGFQPGFAYLLGLPGALVTPRRESPRAAIPRGSVAIGGEWTGIYPAESPGGWHLLGSTDVALFDAAGSPPSRLQPGDRVRFTPE